MSDYVCEGLIFEIFTRLPSKSLLRFRSLSKSLCSMISSPGFICTHTSQCPLKLLLRHQNNHFERDDTEDSYTLHSEDQLPLCPIRGYIGITRGKFPYNKYNNVVGSSNGIICLVDHGNHISLWNPSIRRKLTLSDSLWRSCGYPVSIGFGFDPITDDYKIVTIPIEGGIAGCSFVYSLKADTWCDIASPTPLSSFVLSNACFVNGTLHWMVLRYSYESFKELIDFSHIMTFDLSTHVFGMIPAPEPSWERQELTIIQGSLAIFSPGGSDSRIWVWRDASWTLFFKLKPNKVEGGFKRVMHLTSNGDLLFSTYSCGLQVYNLKKGSCSRLVNFDAASCLGGIVPYVESLQWLDKKLKKNRHWMY